MEGLGDMSLDFSFEDLEFIGDAETNEGEINNESNEAGQATAGTEGTTEGETTGGLETAEAQASQEIKDNKIEETGEGATPESVASKSAEVDDNATGGEETSPKLYTALATVLKEKGVLTSAEDSSLDKVNDVDALVELLKKQIETEELRDLSEEQRVVLKGMREGVQSETASQYTNAMSKLNAIDDTMLSKEDNKQVRFDLIYQNFLSKGHSQDKASKYANRSFQLKEDLQDAKDAKESLKTAVTARYEQAKVLEVDAERAKLKDAEKEKTTLKEAILAQEEPIKGVKIPENVRNEVYQDMVTTVSTNPSTGEVENSLMKYKRENPVDYNHKLYYLFKVTNGFQDLDYFGRKQTTSSVSALENAMRQSTHVSGGGNPTFADDGQSHILDIGDLVLPGQE